jgi:hypothetical protein
MFDGKPESWLMFKRNFFARLLQLGHRDILSDREDNDPERQHPDSQPDADNEEALFAWTA